MTVRPIEVGAWVIVDDGFGKPVYRVVRVIKVTEQKVVATETSHSAGRHFYKDKVLYVGTEPECARYVERLNSSVGLMTDEVRKSRARHDNRAKRILAEAKGEDQ